jgi:hypothetical protein
MLRKRVHSVSSLLLIRTIACADVLHALHVLAAAATAAECVCTKTVYCSHLKSQLQAVELVRCDSFCQVAWGVWIDAF